MPELPVTPEQRYLAQAKELKAEIEWLRVREEDLCKRLYDERRETLRLQGQKEDLMVALREEGFELAAAMRMIDRRDAKIAQEALDA